MFQKKGQLEHPDEILYLVSNRFSRFFARFKLYFKREASIANASFKISAAFAGVFDFRIISAIFTPEY